MKFTLEVNFDPNSPKADDEIIKVLKIARDRVSKYGARGSYGNISLTNDDSAPLVGKIGLSDTEIKFY